MKQSENWIISKLFNNNSSRRAYSLVWVQGKICQHYKQSRLRYFIFKVVTLIKPEMYNILIATSQHTSLFSPLRSFLLPAPTALLRPVVDSGLVKSSNLSYTWHSRGSLRCRDSDSKEKVKRQQDEFSTAWKFERSLEFATTIFRASRNTALQHCCDIVSNGCNIVPTLQRCVAAYRLV